jgi:hypothetical protein
LWAERDAATEFGADSSCGYAYFLNGLFQLLFGAPKLVGPKTHGAILVNVDTSGLLFPSSG